jgi:hypothetical protein
MSEREVMDELMDGNSVGTVDIAGKSGKRKREWSRFVLHCYGCNCC